MEVSSINRMVFSGSQLADIIRADLREKETIGPSSASITITDGFRYGKTPLLEFFFGLRVTQRVKNADGSFRDTTISLDKNDVYNLLIGHLQKAGRLPDAKYKVFVSECYPSVTRGNSLDHSSLKIEIEWE